MARIALVGLKRCGKDTFANIAVREFGFTANAFANSLKRYARELFPNEFKSTDKPVELYQKFGTYMREIDPNVWINKMDSWLNTIEEVDNDFEVESNIIITDCRYPNELEYLRNKGFIIIKIDVDFMEACTRCAMTEEDTWTFDQMWHSSEELAREGSNLMFDVVIENNGSLEEYEAKVRGYLNVLMGNELHNMVMGGANNER